MTILEIEGVFNVRDVGGMPANGGRIRSGALLRAGQLSGATTSGAAALRARVQHIVDLRDGEEVAAEPSEIEGPDTTHLPLFLGSVRSFFEADTSLDDLYLHLLEESGERLADAIRIIAAGERTLVHCTVGKDRTGVTVALALSAVGADREAVIADYALTESQLPAQRSQRIADYLRTQHPAPGSRARGGARHPVSGARDAAPAGAGGRTVGVCCRIPARAGGDRRRAGRAVGGTRGGCVGAVDLVAAQLMQG